MLKAATENKDFIGTFGSKIRRQDLEDPQRRGHLREGLLLEPDAWSAALHWGLRTPGGRSIGFIEPSRDAREPHASEAPESLRQSLAAAQGDFDGPTAERQKVVDELARVEDEIRTVAEAGWSRRVPANEAQRRMAELEINRQTAEERLRELDNFRLPPARHRLSEAQKRVQWWLDDERIRRTQPR